VPASSSEIGISDFPYRMSEGQDGRMADAPPPASQPGTRVKLRYRPSMDEIIGAVEEDTQISRRAPRRDAVEDGAEFFWHLRPDIERSRSRRRSAIALCRSAHQSPDTGVLEGSGSERARDPDPKLCAAVTSAIGADHV
jgi:hypothetical protein